MKPGAIPRFFKSGKPKSKKPPSDIKTVLKIGLENTGHGFSVVHGYFNILMAQETIKRTIPKSKD